MLISLSSSLIPLFTPNHIQVCLIGPLCQRITIGRTFKSYHPGLGDMDGPNELHGPGCISLIVPFSIHPALPLIPYPPQLLTSQSSMVNILREKIPRCLQKRISVNLMCTFSDLISIPSPPPCISESRIRHFPLHSLIVRVLSVRSDSLCRRTLDSVYFCTYFHLYYLLH